VKEQATENWIGLSSGGGGDEGGSAATGSKAKIDILRFRRPASQRT